jgi:hypothetical protein
VYASRAAGRALTRRRFSTLGTAVLVVLFAAAIVAVAWPPAVGWLR